MEIALPLGVALLAFGSAWNATGLFGPRDVRGPQGIQGASASFSEGIWGVARTLGSHVPARLMGARPVRRMLDELAHLRLFAHLRDASATREEAAGMLVLLCAAGALGVGVLSMSALGVAGGFVFPQALLSIGSAGRMRSEAKRLETAMPEAFNALSMSLASGHSLAQGMRFVGSHAEEPVKSEFLRVSAAISCGVPAGAALDEMLERMDAPGLDLVALALKVSQRTGAPLKDLLAEASSMVGERIELRRRLDVKTSQARMSAQMVAAMPVALILVLALLSSDFRTGLTTAAGASSIAVALGLNGIAWVFIKKIMKVDL